MSNRMLNCPSGRNDKMLCFDVKSINRFDKVKFDEDGKEIHVLSLVVGFEDGTNTTIRFYSNENVRINDPELMAAARKLIEQEL